MQDLEDLETQAVSHEDQVDLQEAQEAQVDLVEDLQVDL